MSPLKKTKKTIKNKTGERGKGQRVEVIMLQGIWRSLV